MRRKVNISDEPDSLAAATIRDPTDQTVSQASKKTTGPKALRTSILAVELESWTLPLSGTSQENLKSAGNNRILGAKMQKFGYVNLIWMVSSFTSFPPATVDGLERGYSDW